MVNLTRFDFSLAVRGTYLEKADNRIGTNSENFGSESWRARDLNLKVLSKVRRQSQRKKLPGSLPWKFFDDSSTPQGCFLFWKQSNWIKVERLRNLKYNAIIGLRSGILFLNYLVASWAGLFSNTHLLIGNFLLGPLKRPAISIVTKQKGISMWNYSAKPDILSYRWDGKVNSQLENCKFL